MINFSEFLSESKGGKNLHLEHIEDEILNFGIDGGRSSIEFLRSLRNMLSGESKTSVNMTVKWDGAPAIFAGIDPSDGKFFVAKKSVFNATPLLYKSVSEINSDTKLSDSLKSKFSVAYKEFSKLGIKGVIQGDLMFTDDVSEKTIDGESYLTFQQNTLMYAVQKDSDLGKQISRAKIGVVWHTTYSGSDLPSMKASFGVNISGLNKPSSVWMDDATYKDVSGSAKFSKKETIEITKILSSVGRDFRKIKSTELKSFLKLQEKMKGGTFKTYLNTFIKSGENFSIKNVSKLKYSMYVKNYYDDKIISKLKSQKGKDKRIKERDDIVKSLIAYDSMVVNLIKFMQGIVDAKLIIINKLNSIKQLTSIFVKTNNGYEVTNPEGYVAIDRSGNAVKLVDRMEFSFNNFTAAKNWDK